MSDDEADGTGTTPRTDGGMAETWEPRPLPEVTPESEPYWRAASEGRLLLSECVDCGLVIHYPRAYCPDCMGETEWIESDGAGTVYSFSPIGRMEGWPEEALPLVVAYVELDEGPRMMTNLVDCDPATLSVGDRVDVRFVPTEDPDVAVPVFEPR